ncbi:EcsC family protein [Actinomycetospora atypica]|uniref:EcsC family protein n=1 Tax=Actinomycetospora atypica TaxID=1290095 RepID=A0ABV9YM35_9PSEU
MSTEEARGERMPAGDRAHWQRIQQWKADRLPAEGTAAGWGLVPTIVDALGRVPGADGVGRAVVDGLARLIDLGAGTSAASVRTGPILERHRARGHAVTELADVRALPMDDIRDAHPRLDVQYAVGGAVQGVASGVVVSGGTVLTVVGAVGTAGIVALPGVGAVAATIVLDAAVGVLVSTRAVAHVAAYHGYDVREPRERLFALGVLSLGLADDTRRAAAYREITALAGGLARREAWRLTAAEAEAVVRSVSTSLALRLTQDRFAQVVPLLGTALAVRRSARSLARVVDDAEHLYAERVLRERYDLDGTDPGERGEIASAVDAELAAR